MTSKSRTLFLLGFVAILVLALLSALVLREQRRPIRIAREVSGLDLPDDALLLYTESSWGNFLPDGHSIFVFEIPASLGMEVIADCGKHDFQPGGPNREGVRVPALDAQFDQGEPLCHRVRSFRYGMDVVIASRERVGVYVSRY